MHAIGAQGRHIFWIPRSLGQDVAAASGSVWGDIFSSVIKAGAAAYGAYQQHEIAEEMKDAAEAKAAAERAQAEAAKIRAEAEIRRAAGLAPDGGTPISDYILYGGIGLGAIGLAVLIYSLAKK